MAQSTNRSSLTKFEDIPFFHLMVNRGNEHQDVHEFLTHHEIFDLLADYPYVCIVPKAFGYYSAQVFEKECLRNSGENYYDPEDEQYVLDKPLTPIWELLGQTRFLKMRKTIGKDTYEIEQEFDAKQLIGYWMERNRFTDPNALKTLGLTEKIFNGIPNHHSYYDRNMICTCGEEGCSNTEVWYVKNQYDYHVPFVIDLNKHIVFDVVEFAGKHDWEAEDYTEKSYTFRSHYGTFPFLFEADGFELYKKLLQAS